jgi:type I restriction enzyme R subunit
VGQAASVLTGELIELLDSIRRDKEQTIDHDNLDRVLRAEWAGETTDNARALTQEFADYLTEHQDEIEALTIYFSQPARRADVTYAMVQTLLERLRQDRPRLAPLRVWQAYAHLDDYQGDTPLSELVMLVALVRRVCGLDATLAPYEATVRRNFQRWILRRHSGAGAKFSEDQMAWLRMIRDHVASSVRLERDDLELAPFDAQGGLGRMYVLFGDEMDGVIEELNRELVA